ncbi:MAG: AMP-binding protein [Myxococcales bacterium]|nr:AMP-binding protein [Myxococcales bacterium]
MSTQIADEKLLLQQAYDKEKHRSDELYLTQPVGGGRLDTYSWARFMDETRRIASYLKAQNFPPKSHIAIISKNCAQFLMTDLAIWMSGHVSVALYPTLNAETVSFILEHSEAKMLFVGKLDTWNEMKEGVPEDMPLVSYPLSPKNDYTTWNDLVAEYEPIEGNPTRPAGDLALIMYTSGSTGPPKGVMHSFQSISAASHLIVEALSLGKDDRLLSYLPLAHALERWLVDTCGLVAGFEIYFAESLETFVADLQRARPTLFMSVPRLWQKFQAGILKKMPQKKLNTMLKIPILGGIVKKKLITAIGLQYARVAGSGSAPIAGELLEWYRALGLEILEGYGMSENFCCSHISIPGRVRVGYVGETYPGVKCKIGKDGEILVNSAGNMLGYYKMPEESAESFTEDGYLRTGDRGEIDSMGRLKITGRTKELFKTSKGKYIAPAPIENIINTHPKIDLSCVSGSGYPRAYSSVMLSEELYKKIDDQGFRDQVEKEFTALLSDVNARVEGFEQLQFFVISGKPWTIEDNLLTPTQKIKRAKIEEVFDPTLDAWYESQKKVIWQ